nr:HIT domain-containing protein [Cytophagales bacterium]
MTLFEKIAAREIPADFIHEDEYCFAIRDIHPQSPTHILLIPKKPIPRIGESTRNDAALLGHLLSTIPDLARTLGISQDGYRVVINNGPHGGESVPHLHIHILGGRPLQWPPG